MANELTTTIAATTDLAHANLARYAKDAQGAFAPNTVRALRADTAVFTAWCDTAGVPALPAAPQTVADFIDAMRAASKRPATIRRYVSSIAHLHRAAELPVPSDSNTVKLALRRMMKEDGAAQQQADVHPQTAAWCAKREPTFSDATATVHRALW
jgi:site-specific recombinase XerD